MVKVERLSKHTSWDICVKCRQSLKSVSYCLRTTRTCWRTDYHSRYHIQCYATSNCVKRPQCSAGIEGLETLEDEEAKREIYQCLYPMLVVDLQQRISLSLPMSIDKMKIKDLKLELSKRDLQRTGNKQVLIDRLQKWLEKQSSYKSRSNKLVVGFCREMEGSKHKMTIPIYLKHIVLDYHGLQDFNWWHWNNME